MPVHMYISPPINPSSRARCMKVGHCICYSILHFFVAEMFIILLIFSDTLIRGLLDIQFHLSSCPLKGQHISFRILLFEKCNFIKYHHRTCMLLQYADWNLIFYKKKFISELKHSHVCWKEALLNAFSTLSYCNSK